MCQVVDKSSSVSTVWWACVSGRSSSADVWSQTGCPRSDSLWTPFWEEGVCEHNTGDHSEHHEGFERFKPKAENKMKRFRREISYRLWSPAIVYHAVGGLSESEATAGIGKHMKYVLVYLSLFFWVWKELISKERCEAKIHNVWGPSFAGLWNPSTIPL